MGNFSTASATTTASDPAQDRCREGLRHSIPPNCVNLIGEIALKMFNTKFEQYSRKALLRLASHPVFKTSLMILFHK